jgi:hypothetical protein
MRMKIVAFAIQTTDPTGFWVIALPALALTTYPLSCILVLLGVVRNAGTILATANRIFRHYIMFGFAAMLFCMLICFFIMIFLILCGGALVWIGVIKPNSFPFLETLIFIGIPIHVVGQLIAYRNALRDGE